MKQLKRDLLIQLLLLAALAFALGFTAGIEARHRNDANIQEARER